MKSIHRNYGKKIFVTMISFILIFALIFKVSTNHVWAAPLEDCDLDGYDDATGVPVPWPGYDETKGDTPSGPGGGSTSGKTGGSSGGTTGGSTGGTTGGSSGGTTGGNTGGSTGGSTGGTTGGNTGGSTGGNTGGSTGSNTGGTKNNTNTNTNTNKSKNEDQNDGSQNNEETPSEDSNIDGTEENDITAQQIESIVSTKGSLEIAEANGSTIHVGSTIIITGQGFSENVKGIDIEIHSKPRHLETVVSSKDGSFEVKINIPDDLEAGKHNIVVLYQGKEITRQQIEVGSKVADSFLQALLVGFTKNNKELIPGLLILASLATVGVVTLLINKPVRSRRKKRTA